MKRIVLVIAVLALLLSATRSRIFSAESVKTLPVASREKLQAALQAMDRFAQLSASRSLDQKGLEELSLQADRFDEALDGLAASIDPSTVSTTAKEETIEAKLVAIAWDRRQRREAYDEIENEYVSMKAYLDRLKREGGTQPQSVGPDRIAGRHRAASYRLVWEYFLLQPLRDRTRKKQWAALSAIKDIRDERSLVTLRHLFALNRCNHRVLTNHQQTEQSRLLAAIVRFPSTGGLQTLMDCMAMTDGQPRGPENSGPQWNVERAVLVMLLPNERWKEVIQTASLPDLPEKQRRFLQDLRLALRENAPSQ